MARTDKKWCTNTSLLKAKYTEAMAKIKAGTSSTQQEEEHNISDGKQAFNTATFNLKDEFNRKLYSDQTGRFPVTSFKGNQYIMVAYDMDMSNVIMVEPMKKQNRRRDGQSSQCNGKEAEREQCQTIPHDSGQ